MDGVTQQSLAERVEPRTWFEVANLVGDQLVPRHCSWVLLHVRSSVLELVRRGEATSLCEVPPPVAGDELSIAALRHQEPELEVALREMVQTLTPRVGDPYGSGRVVLTGQSRLAATVNRSYLKAIATGPRDLELLSRMDLGSIVTAPVVSDGVVLGALNLLHHRAAALDGTTVEVAEELGRRFGAALDASRPATRRLVPVLRPSLPTSWQPDPRDPNPVAGARRWVRRVLPDLVRHVVRDDLPDDLDLVVSELGGNAVRHTGLLVEVGLTLTDDALRLVVADGDHRAPHVREPSDDGESGRGMLIVDALTTGWGTEHDLVSPGKRVWADLPLGYQSATEE